MIRLRVPGSLAYRHLAVRLVSAACKIGKMNAAPSEEGLEDDEFEAQTVSAFGEAFNNIALHGYENGPGDVDIDIQSDSDGIVIQLVDKGSSFDPASVAAPVMEDLPESGMGLFIINAFMDEVEYRPGSPNVLRLSKRRGTRASLSGGGDAEEDDAGADFNEGSTDHRANGQSTVNVGRESAFAAPSRMRSVARTSRERAAGGIKIT